MAKALQQVADLNNISVSRHSWRHGSIAWRQNYLRSLLGKPSQGGLPIDREVMAIKLVGGMIVITMALSQWLEPDWVEQLIGL